jgi:hypothetical protein
MNFGKYENLDWHIYSDDDEENDTNPMNGVRCIIRLADGEYARDYQDCGEWHNSEVVAWAYWDDSILNL